jgi:hypothetical protein
MDELCDNLSNIRIMETWLSQCDSCHTLCTKHDQSFVPTRLLDLKAFALKASDIDKRFDLRLIATETLVREHRPIDYVALSHCWGRPDKHPIMTYKSNIEDQTTCISFASLSRTFRDAVQIVRQLNKRYLWIDSLCIIQNDETDWAKESALMGDVYSNAYCTLSALSSKDGTGGCQQAKNIRHRYDTFVTDIHIGREDERNIRFRLTEMPPISWSDDYMGGSSDWDSERFEEVPLNSRAWTLQERVLSRRTIHFGKWQMLWECFETRLTAQAPWGKQRDDRYDPHTSLDAFKQPLYTKSKWYALLADYVERSLSVDSDKLTALSGLAHRYQAAFPGSQYVAGIWASELPGALLWYEREGKGRRYKSYVAPTWSWASLEDTGYIDELDSALAVHTKSSVEETMAKLEIGSPTVLHTSTLLKYNDQYGAVTEGYITLSGALIIHIDSIPSTNAPYEEWGTWLTKDEETIGWFYRDTCDDETTDKETFILLLGLKLDDSDRVSEVTTGLVLLRASTGESRFVRVGLAVNVERALFRGSQPSVVTLL